jgi:Zinc finger, C2H2 type/C2H2-type zinc finger
MAAICAVCGAGFGSTADLLGHMTEAHSHDRSDASLKANPEASRPGYVCALCGVRFSNPQALARHNLSPHARVPARDRQWPVLGTSG